MKWIVLSLAALLLAFILPGQVLAQVGPPQNAPVETKQEETTAAAIRLAGTVRTAKGIPVPGAPMRVLHLQTGKAWMTTSDENGDFALPGLPPGRYRIEARQLGLGTASEEVELTQNAEGVELRLSRALSGKTEAKPSVTTEPMKSVGAEAGKAQAAKAQAAKAEAAKEVSPGQPKANDGNEAYEAESRSDAKVKKVHRHPQDTREGKPEEATKSSGKGKPSTGSEVELKGEPTAAGELSNPADTDPAFGQAPSADAFLISGTVGRSAVPQQAGEEGDSAGKVGSDETKKPQRQHGSKKGKKQFGQSGPDEGLDEVATEKQMARLTANRVRFSFSNRYGNSVGDAKAYSLTDPHPSKIPYSRERFRTRIGGPLNIPHLYHGGDRTFFFLGYEFDRNKTPLDTFETVPLPQERNGDFAARGVQLFDPLSNIAGPRTAMGSVIPASRMDPTALALLKYLPLPNLPGTDQNLHLQTSLPQSSDRLNIRILRTISSQLSFQANYNLNSMRGELAFVNPGLRSYLNTREQNVTLGLIQNWTPRLLNETRINWTRSRSVVQGQFTFKEDVASELSITGASSNPFYFGVPNVLLNNFDPIEDVLPQFRLNQTFRFLDNLSYSFSKHTLRAGGEIRRMQLNFLLASAPRGEFNFSGLMTSQLDAKGNPVPDTGFDFADFLLGLPDQTVLGSDSHTAYMRSWWAIGYFQDDWRIHPRLSLNLGVRYEVRTPAVEKLNRLADLDLNSNITAAVRVTPGQVGPFSGRLPDSLIRTQYNNLAPRIGIAWRPLSKRSMVVRAGYGVFFNAATYNQLDSELAQQPPFAQEQRRLTSVTNLLTLQNGFPPQPPDAVLNTLAVDPNFKVPYAQIWNLSTEMPIRPNLTVELTYTGTKGTHLNLSRSPNRPTPGDPLTIESRRRIPNFSAFLYETSAADSIYHAAQLRVQRRMSHGLEIMGLYTFGKSIDNATFIGGGKRIVAQNDMNLAADRGLSAFDVRHQFTLVHSYDLPFGEQKRWLRHGLLADVLGNWEISGDTSIATGTPFTVFVGGAAATGGGTVADSALRPDLVGNPSLPAGQRTAAHYFNTAAFVLPPAGRYGTAGRSTVIGPGRFNVNFQLRRKWRLGKGERYHLTSACEVQNLTNRPNFQGLENIFGESVFGRVSSVAPMRTIDFTMRVSF
jgi:hypothetical protein